MKRVSLVILTLLVVTLFAANEAAAQNTVATGEAKSPTIDAFIALEKQANEAFNKGDAKFFEGRLSDKFVMRDGRQRLGKAAFVKMLAGVECDVKTWNLDEEWLAKIDADAYVLSYRYTLDGTCGKSDDEPLRIPSPIRAARVWVRSGDKWQAAFQGGNRIVDPKTQQVSPSAGLASTTKVRRGDVDSKALAAVETAVWEAWKNHDRKKLDDLTTRSLSFIDIFGNSYNNRDAILETWSSNICKVNSVKVTDAVAFALSPTVKLLTHTGTTDGTCYGQTIGPVYGNSIYIKEGRGWKLAFTMNMPGK